MSGPDLYADGHLPRSAVPGLSFPSFVNGQDGQILAMLGQLEATQWWPLARLRARQLTQLETLLRHAHATTPYAKGKAWADLGDQPLTWERWRQVPLLSRTTVQRRAADLRSTQVSERHGPVGFTRTSGSTSTPVEVHRTGVTAIVWQALTMRDHLWHRRDLDAPMAILRYAPNAAPPDGVTAKGWGPIPQILGGTGVCHVLHVAATTQEQLAWLRAREAAYVLVYPSSLKDLVAASPTCPVRGLRSIRTFGEICDDALRTRVREAWGVEIEDMYSTEEVGYLGLQCPEHPHLHAQSESALIEVLRDDGTPCEAGETGRIVVTPLHNFAMPLLRYDIGDYAVVGAPCSCGRGLPVLSKVIGRVHETFVTRDGDRVFLTVGIARLPDLAPVAQHQWVQTAPGEAELRLVAHRPPTPDETAAVEAHVGPAMPPGSQLTVRWVDEIPRTPRGKFLSFRSEIE